MANASMSLTGDKELKRMLHKLPEKSQRGVIRKSVNAAASPILKDARKEVGKHTGTLRKALTKKTKTYKQSGVVMALIGAKRRAAPHEHLVLYGTGPRYKKSTGQYTGRMPENNALQKAYDRNASKALASYKTKWPKAIEAEARKLAKRK